MSTQTSVWDKVTGFVAAHKAAVIVGSAVVVGSGAGAYYYYVNSLPSSDDSKPKPSKKKLTKHDKKKLKKAREAGSKKTETAASFNLVKDEGQSTEYPDIADFSAVKDLPEDERKELAQQFKLAGNEYFSQKKFEEALSLYSKAIQCFNDPIFYSNKAACYSSLQQYEKVIEETSAALELKPDYQKCLLRRAAAYEKLENYPDALYDYTCSLILSNFQDASLNVAVDRVLKNYAELEAMEMYKNRPKQLPSAASVSAFFRSFCRRDLPEEVTSADPESGDYEIKLGFESLKVETIESYEQAQEHFEAAIQKNAAHSSIAYTYRAIFKFLKSDTPGAQEDIKVSIDTEPSYLSYVIRANLSMDDGNVAAAHLDYENALKISPDAADIYYHRAQIAFITGDLKSAMTDYEKCISLDPEFILAHIQLAVSYYREGNSDKSAEMFENLCHTFPHSSDVHNYYGEILMDQKKFSEAIAKFDKAIEASKSSSGAFNVLPIVNKALATFQYKNDVAECIKLCLQAITLDPLNDVAHATLAQIYLQAQNSVEAYKYLMKSAQLSRSVAEMVQHLCLAYATKTQIRILAERPFLTKRLEALQTAMAASQQA